MNVNFTGIKNVGYEFRKYREAVYDDGSFEFLDPDEDMDKDEYDEDIQDHYLTVQLTDDFQGKDLTEFSPRLAPYLPVWVKWSSISMTTR